ncbi:MAG: response regulator transcription factor [Alphaproteobacteria bacterium]|nr:response regulator transcription factor [Alphaproteobacteria bacterium]
MGAPAEIRAVEAPAPVHVLIVDDDSLLRESLEQNLIDAGFRVTGFSNGPDVLAHFASTTPDRAGRGDLILLDWKMPEMNGIEVLKQLRDRKLDVPVVFLTVLSDQIYEEAALLGGAVDFVEKSRSFAILRRRIELILDRQDPSETRSGGAPGGAVEVGPLELDPGTSRALWRGERVDLTLTEFKIVHHLAERAGTDIRYREIYDLVHGEGFIAGAGDDGYRSNVRTFIKRIRQKFRDVDADFAAIETYTGFGYRWASRGGQDKPGDG